MTPPVYMICHVEGGAAYPLPQFDDTRNLAAARYDLLVWLDEAIAHTALDADCNLTITSDCVRVDACDGEWAVMVVELPFIEGGA